MKSRVRAALRLWTATGTSRLAMLRARLAPITARPVTPIWLSPLMAATLPAGHDLRQCHVMHVAQLWRYPVKSLAGEPLAEAQIELDGVGGDRLVHIQGPHGLLTSRTKPRLLGLKGTLDVNGQALVGGHRWDGPEALAAIQAAAGPDTGPLYYAGPRRFDVLPLLVATDGAIAAFGRDGRRLRPNLVIGGVEGLAERQWPGGRLRIGDVVIGLDSRRARCVMTTFDPDTQEQEVGVLRGILDRFGGELALNAIVEQPGVIRLNDPVELLLPG